MTACGQIFTPIPVSACRCTDGVFKTAVQELEPFFTGHPEVTYRTVFSAEFKQ